MPIIQQTINDFAQDVATAGEVVNEDKVVTPRYGAPFKSLPMLSQLFEAMLISGQTSLSDLEQAIDIAAAAGAGANGWTDQLITTADGSTQRNVNDFGGAKWRNKAGGYALGSTVKLNNGDIVKSTLDGNTNNPNLNMTGWVKANSASQIFQSNGLSQEVRNSQDPTILDFFTSSELATFNSNPSMDMTAIVKRAFATGVKKLNCLDLQMNITISSTVDDPLAIFEDGDVELFGNGAAFIDNTNYNTTAASFNPLFILNGGVTSFKSNIAHIGLQIPSMATQIGYRGATYVYSKGANKNITLNCYLENTRYGILAGNYALPELGGTKGVRGWLRCKNVGYPIATYLADDIELTITGDGFHRVHYIAGCNHARIKTLTKNYYIAPIAHLYSDAKTGEGTSKGCFDCCTEAHDQGSTQYVTNSYLVGLSLSRVDPNTVYDGVTMIGHVNANNGVAEKLGLATIVSSVRTVQPSYPANWESSIYLNNIKIKGVIDRRAQTTEEHGFSDLYLSCVDDVSVSGERRAATIRNLNIDVDYFAGTGNKPRGFWWFLDGLQDVANVRLNAKSSGLNVIKSNPNSLIKFRDSAIIGVDASASTALNSKMEFIDSDIYGGNAYLPPTNKRFSNTKVGSVAPPSIRTVSNELTLTGASVTWANALPIHAMILGVTFVITQEITGSSGLLIGDGTTVGKFISSPLTAVGAGIGLSNAPASTFPYITPGTRNIVVTARDSGGGTAATFTSGKVKVVVNYIEIPIPS